LQDVVTAAKQSQVVIVAVGEAPESETEGDTNDLSLSPSQVLYFLSFYILTYIYSFYLFFYFLLYLFR